MILTQTTSGSILTVLSLQKVPTCGDLTLQPGLDVQLHLVLLALSLQVSPDLGQLLLHVATRLCIWANSVPKRASDSHSEFCRPKKEGKRLKVIDPFLSLFRKTKIGRAHV